MAPRWPADSTAPWLDPDGGRPGELPRPSRRYRVRRRLRLRPEARLVAAVGTLFLLAVLVVSRYAVLYEMNRAILQRQQELATLQRATERLEIEVAGLDSLERLESAARQRGYEEPASVRAVRVPAPAVQAADPGAPARSPAARAGAPGRPVREAVIALAPAEAPGPSPARPAAGSGETAAAEAAAAGGTAGSPGAMEAQGAGTGPAPDNQGTTEGPAAAGWLLGLWRHWLGG
ncbi:septum formation initiator [Thermaerobacter sp. PB12/4term]|nr:septum formation initiator [Thermaerobacter sp. PB12/4term]